MHLRSYLNFFPVLQSEGPRAIIYCVLIYGASQSAVESRTDPDVLDSTKQRRLSNAIVAEENHLVVVVGAVARKLLS
jgi:hypothetical protein